MDSPKVVRLLQICTHLLLVSFLIRNGGWRLIAIRSAPGSYSSNDFIGPYFCTIKYMLPLMTKFHLSSLMTYLA